MIRKMDVVFSPVKQAGVPGNWFFDFGKHWFAVLEIEAETSQEQEITLAVGEVLKVVCELLHINHTAFTVNQIYFSVFIKQHGCIVIVTFQL